MGLTADMCDVQEDSEGERKSCVCNPERQTKAKDEEAWRYSYRKDERCTHLKCSLAALGLCRSLQDG
jgi:hypothetical protein